MYNYAVQTATDFYQIVPGCVRRQEGAWSIHIESGSSGNIQGRLLRHVQYHV